MATIALPLDVAEGHVVLAALTLYEALLAHCREVGGDAAAVAVEMGPIAERVSRRLALVMYPDPPEDVARREAVDLSLGDHYIGMPS
jgi:hypothetical protein